MATDDQVLDAALAAHAAGLAVVPPREDGTKAPDVAWRDYQHCPPDETQVRAWYGNGRRRHGLGVLTGVASRNLEMLELEGRASHLWQPFVTACTHAGLKDLLDQIVAGYAELTPSGGIHLLYRSDQTVDGNRKLARAADGQVLLETRGEGGYVVVAPSAGPTHATGQPWVLRSGGFATIATITADERAQLLAVAAGFDATPRTEPAPPTPGATRPGGASWMDDVADAYNRATTWPQILEGHGWQHHHRHGQVDYWTRPDKNPRDGHSATTNANGTDRLIVFSSSVPGFTAADGNGPAPSYDRFGATAILDHHGDRLEAARHLRDTGHGPPRQPHHDVLTDIGARKKPQPTPVLPETFWDRRPVLRHIRQAAHSRNRSADVVLHGILARVAACSPHTIEIPPIVGAPGSLNYFVAITGPSGSGKSSGAHIANELLPSPPGVNLVDDQPLGSGEGLAELYMGTVDEEGPGGKTIKVRRQTRHNAFVYGDEGAALTAMMDRSGATLPEALRRAWTGAALGQANASADRKRVIKHGQYRLGLLIGFQPELAGRLLADHVAGTPQRFLWASAIDPTIPDTPPDWPGPLEWEPPSPLKLKALEEKGTGGFIRQRLQIHDDIQDSIRAADLARVRGETAIAELDAHQPLHLLKTAGLLAILDNRLDIDIEDWQLAHTIWEASLAVRNHVIALVHAEAEAEEERRIAAHASRELVAEAARQGAPAAVARVAAVIARKIHQNNDDDLEPDNGYATRDLQRHIAGRDKRLSDAAIDHAVALGWLTDNNGRYTAGESRPA